MNVPNPIVYWFCLNAWEQYRRDERLPVKSLPPLVPEYIETGVASRLLSALRALLAPQRPAARASQSQPVGLHQQATATYPGAH